MSGENFGNGFATDRTNPCYGCVAPKRHPGCHDSCKDRAEWLVSWEARKKHLSDYLDSNSVSIQGTLRVGKSIKTNGLVYGSKWRSKK